MKMIDVFWQGEKYTVVVWHGTIDAIINCDGINIEPQLSDVAFCEVQDLVNYELECAERDSINEHLREEL